MTARVAPAGRTVRAAPTAPSNASAGNPTGPHDGGGRERSRPPRVRLAGCLPNRSGVLVTRANPFPNAASDLGPVISGGRRAHSGVGDGPFHRKIVGKGGARLRRRPAGAGLFDGAARRGRCPHEAHPFDRPQPADHLGGDGYGDRGAPRHRHGPGRRYRRHPPQPHARRTGRAGPPGEEIRVRHGGQSGDHPSRGDARRSPRPDETAQHFRHPGGRGRRYRRAGLSAFSPTAT